MKRLVLILCVAVLAFAQAPVRHGDVAVTADRIDQAGPVRRLSGKVTIETDTILIHADQADYNENAGEILAHGDVRIKLK
jgi:lipopolysaccharide assembly outer membrane protein LptD (OstA)